MWGSLHRTGLNRLAQQQSFSAYVYTINLYNIALLFHREPERADDASFDSCLNLDLIIITKPILDLSKVFFKSIASSLPHYFFVLSKV
jgi:hypothetical protein